MLSPILGTYLQLSQVPDPMWQVPKDQEVHQERPLVGKGMCAKPGAGVMGRILKSAWGTGVGRGMGAEVQCQRAGRAWVCTSAAVCGDPEGARIF